jgi:PTS system nitrogen regulatory IIA component
MDTASLITPPAVRLAGKVTSKKRLFLILGEIAQAAYGLCPEDTVDALLDRENLGPTGVGGGVALPHARIDGLERVVGAFVRLDSPLDFDAADRQGVDLVFALFAPTNAGAEHLKALALASRTLRDPGICTKLRSNADAATIHAILTEAPASRAA